jgi:hypothetical protein
MNKIKSLIASLLGKLRDWKQLLDLFRRPGN